MIAWLQAGAIKGKDKRSQTAAVALPLSLQSLRGNVFCHGAARLLLTTFISYICSFRFISFEPFINFSLSRAAFKSVLSQHPTMTFTKFHFLSGEVWCNPAAERSYLFDFDLNSGLPVPRFAPP